MQNQNSDSTLQTLSLAGLERAFADRSIGIPLHFLETVDSTNTLARRLLLDGETPPFAVLASSQTAGRGRFDRKWIDEPGKSVLLTLALPASSPKGANWSAFCPLCALCICEALASYSGAEPKIKWPNDIYINGRKLSGMIAEGVLKNGAMDAIIFGVGLNFAMPATAEGELSDSLCALLPNSKRPIDICHCAAELARAALRARDCIANSDMDSFSERFARFDLLRGLKISVNNFTSKTSGIASGVDKDGCLILKKEGGIFLCKAGEASIIKNFKL